MIRTISAALLLLVLTGCGKTGFSTQDQLAALDLVDRGALLIDVRSDEEVQSGMLPGAIHIPHGEILDGIKTLAISQDQDMVLYCRSGNRSGKAIEALAAAGFTSLTNAGGYEQLQALQKPDGS